MILRESHERHQGWISNIPYRYKLAWWHEWGYVGTGPFDLSINILYHFTGKEYFARGWCKDFVVEVLAKLPHRVSVRVPHSVIEDWIEKKWARSCQRPIHTEILRQRAQFTSLVDSSSRCPQST